MSDSPTLTLRGQRTDDLEALFTLFNTADMLRDSVDLPYLAEEAFRERYSGLAARSHTLIAEASLPSGRTRIVGAAWLTAQRQRRRHVGDLRLAVHPEYRGTAAEVGLLRAALDLADQWLDLRRIEVVVYSDLEASLALYEAHGFVREVTCRRYAFRDGRYADAILLARLQPAALSAPPAAAPAAAGSGARALSRRGGTPHIYVRGVEADDWEDISDLREGDNVIFNTLQVPYLSRDKVRDYLENLPEDHRELVAVVDGRVVGQLGLHLNSGRRAHAASLGMMVHSDFQGRGVGSALLGAAIALAEDWLNISRIELEVYPDNTAALALYRQFGFEIEGTLRADVYRAGRYVDAYAMARVHDDRAGQA